MSLAKRWTLSALHFCNGHGLQTPRKEIAFTAQPKIHSHIRPKHILSATLVQFFRYLWFMPSLGVHSPCFWAVSFVGLAVRDVLISIKSLRQKCHLPVGCQTASTLEFRCHGLFFIIMPHLEVPCWMEKIVCTLQFQVIWHYIGT